MQPSAIESITKPHWTNGSWKPINITFVNYIGSSVSKHIYDMINLSDSVFDQQMLTFSIKSLDQKGKKVEKWTITAFITNIHFGINERYTDQADTKSKIHVTLQPIECKLSI